MSWPIRLSRDYFGVDSHHPMKFEQLPVRFLNCMSRRRLQCFPETCHGLIVRFL